MRWARKEGVGNFISREFCVNGLIFFTWNDTDGKGKNRKKPDHKPYFCWKLINLLQSPSQLYLLL